MEEFRLQHYAGEVSYSIRGFLDKNNDLLYRDLKQAMAESTNDIIAKVYPKVRGKTRFMLLIVLCRFTNQFLNLKGLSLSIFPLVKPLRLCLQYTLYQ